MGGTDDPVEHTPGRGEGVRGWDIACKSMRVGEVAEFVLQPSLAFGGSGDGMKVCLRVPISGESGVRGHKTLDVAFIMH